MSRARVAFIFILALTLALPLAAGAQEYRIGFISAITGPASSLGVPERDVAVMIQKELEAKGGLAGPDGKKYPVKIFIHDDESKADTTVRLVKKLI
ncbi:MAG: ABC transporter substrate-binding protein, partial [candidate division NC10 bacterium]